MEILCLKKMRLSATWQLSCLLLIVLYLHASHQSTTAATSSLSSTKATYETSTQNLTTEIKASIDPSHSNHTTTKKPDSGHKSSTYELVQVHWKHVKDPLVITIVVIIASLAKIGFHHTGTLSTKVPESCVLIIVGIIFGIILKFTNTTDKIFLYAPHEFFIYLLPPIILESAFSLYDRTFVDNIGGVLLFAVWVRTILNCFLIGLSLWGLFQAGAMENIDFTFVQVLVFCALIVAVDPVAVLAVFQEVGVNNTLYFLVFGESLLNDGVTVVMYNVMQVFNEFETITVGQCFLGVAKFCIVCTLATLIGIVLGLIASLLTKFTHSVKIVEPMIVFGFAYASYLLSEMFQFSGIVSIIACGVVMVHYAFHNISKKSKKSIKFISKVMANLCEIIIFMFIGFVTVNTKHEWKSGFILWVTILCIVYRFLVTYFLSSLVNRYASTRVRKISYMEMFMISYGGLRGGICFSLAIMIDETLIPAKNMFVTATLFVIYFTVFVQGGSIKWLTKKLRIAMADSTKEMSINSELSNHMFDHMCTAIEEIVGYSTGQYQIRAKIYGIDDSFIRPKMLRNATTTKLDDFSDYYEKLVMKEHYKNLQLSGAKLPRVKTAIRRLDSEVYLDKLVEAKSKRKDADSMEETVERKEQEMQGANKLLEGDDLKVLQTTLNATRNVTIDKKLPSTKGRRSSIVSFLRQKHTTNKALHVMRRKSNPDAFASSGGLPISLSFNKSSGETEKRHANDTVTEEDETNVDDYDANGKVTFEL